MIMDAQNLFSDGQAVTAAAASTNYIDLQAIRNMGVGKIFYLVVYVTVAFTDAASNSTLAVTIETDDNTGFSSATTTKTVGTFAALSPIGTKLIMPIALDDINERYAQLRYTPANGDLTTGSIKAGFVEAPQQDIVYADALTIS